MLNQLLSEKSKRIQLILYAPNFISVVVIVGMIFLFFSVGGPINNFLSMFGMKADFLTNRTSLDPYTSLVVSGKEWAGLQRSTRQHW